MSNTLDCVSGYFAVWRERRVYCWIGKGVGMNATNCNNQSWNWCAYATWVSYGRRTANHKRILLCPSYASNVSQLDIKLYYLVCGLVTRNDYVLSSAIIHRIINGSSLDRRGGRWALIASDWAVWAKALCVARQVEPCQSTSISITSLNLLIFGITSWETPLINHGDRSCWIANYYECELCIGIEGDPKILVVGK